jgi:hypothetical protein
LKNIDCRKSVGAASALDIYTLYIDDDRYSVPTIDILTAASDEDARRMAQDRLAASTHYHAIAIWQDERLVCELAGPEGEALSDGPNGAP